MGDTDGSSDAAQSALTDEDRHEQPDDGAMRTGNFFSRVFEALSPSDARRTPETSAEPSGPRAMA